MFLQRGIEVVDRIPRLLQLKAGAQHLDAEVIFLIHHHGKSLVLADHHARARLRAAQFPADEMALDENLLFQVGEFAHADVQRTLHRCGRAEGGAAGFQNLVALRGLRPAGERIARKIPREADARHQHDRSLAARGIGQLGRRIDERGDRHGLSARVSGQRFV